MNALQKLNELMQATIVLSDTPILKLQENQELLNNLKRIVSTENFNSIMNSIQDERRYEMDSRMNLVGDLQSVEGKDFTKSYVNFQNRSFEMFSKNAKMEDFVSTLPGAKNSNDKKNLAQKITSAVNALKKTKEAKEFKEVYNSIYSDHALQIGTDRDPTFIQNYIDYTPYLYNFQSYLAIPTLDETVDKPINIALKKNPIIDFKEKELDEFFIKYMEEENLVYKLKLFLRNSTLSPRGSLIAPYKDKDGKVHIKVYNDSQFTYSVMPSYSMFDHNDNEYGISSVYLLGSTLQPGTTCHFYCPGFEPLFGVGKNKLVALKNAAEAVNIYLYTIKVLCIRAQVMIQSWSGEGQTDTLLASMKKMSDQINSKLSLSTSVKLPENAKLEILNNNLNEGFAKVSPIIKEFQAMITGVAPDYLYGSDTAYSANNFNIQLSHQNIESTTLASGVSPALRYIVNTCLNHDVRLEKYRSKTNDFKVVFENLYTPTGQEKVNEDKGKIENIISMAGYPELQEIFKKEKLFPEDSNFPSTEQVNKDIPQT